MFLVHKHLEFHLSTCFKHRFKRILRYVFCEWYIIKFIMIPVLPSIVSEYLGLAEISTTALFRGIQVMMIIGVLSAIAGCVSMGFFYRMKTTPYSGTHTNVGIACVLCWGLAGRSYIWWNSSLYFSNHICRYLVIWGNVYLL